MIYLRPITRDEANAAVRKWHKHHKPPRQSILRTGAFADINLVEMVGAVIVERPKAPALCARPVWFEVTRLSCKGGGHVSGHADNAASKLLGAAWASMRAQGTTRLISYTRVDEDGTCYRAAGWVAVALVDAEEWNHGNKADRWLPGIYAPTTEIVDRVRWEIGPEMATTRVRRVDNVWRR